jgi:hypothetical protein
MKADRTALLQFIPNYYSSIVFAPRHLAFERYTFDSSQPLSFTFSLPCLLNHILDRPRFFLSF